MSRRDEEKEARWARDAERHSRLVADLVRMLRPLEAALLKLERDEARGLRKAAREVTPAGQPTQPPQTAGAGKPSRATKKGGRAGPRGRKAARP